MKSIIPVINKNYKVTLNLITKDINKQGVKNKTVCIRDKQYKLEFKDSIPDDKIKNDIINDLNKLFLDTKDKTWLYKVGRKQEEIPTWTIRGDELVLYFECDLNTTTNFENPDFK